MNRGLIVSQLFTWSEGQKSLLAAISFPAALIKISKAHNSIMMKQAFIIEEKPALTNESFRQYPEALPLIVSLPSFVLSLSYLFALLLSIRQHLLHPSLPLHCCFISSNLLLQQVSLSLTKRWGMSVLRQPCFDACVCYCIDKNS